MPKEFITNIIPKNKCIEMKSPAKGKKTYTLTAKTLNNIWNKAKKINKQPMLVITIPDKKGYFKVEAMIYKI